MRHLIFAIALLCLTVPAYAQNRQPAARPTLTGNPVVDIHNAITPPGEAKLTGDPISDLHAVIMKGGDKLIMHLKLTYALAIAPGNGNPQIDAISAPCAKALVPIVTLVVHGPPSGTVPDGDPMALSPAEVTMAADTSEPEGLPVAIEKIRILRLSLTSPALTIACGPLVQDEVKQAQNLIGGISSLMTGAGLLAIP